MLTRHDILAADLETVLTHTAGVWEGVRGRRVFVTGATGFFGCWLLETFCHANRILGLGASVIALTRDAAAFRRKASHLASDRAVTLVEGDVRTFSIDALRRQVAPEQLRLDFVVHAATDASATLLARDPLRMLDTIVHGTRGTLELARQAGASRLLLTSSGAIYGAQPAALMRIPETYRGGPDITAAGSAYAEGKRFAETLCACYHQSHGIDTVIARCFAFVGPYLPLDTHFAIGNFIRDALRGDDIHVGGDGTPSRSYLYAADLAVWLWTILIRGQSGQAYNVGSAHAVTIADLARTVSTTLGAGVVRIAGVPVPGAPPHRYVPDVTRVTNELGVREWTPLDVAIRKTADWQRRLTTSA